MLRVLFGLPWPVMALIAAGFFWLALNSREWVAEFEAEKAQALEQGVPAPVPLDQFGEENVGLADEVHVTAWINPDYNYELTKQRKGTDSVRRMFVLFGPGDGPESTVARGVVVLHPGQVQTFIDLVATHVADPLDPRLLFNLNGARESSPDLSSMVDDALAERGLMKDADFLAVEPYLEGRAVALAPDPDAPDRNFMMIGGVGLVAALLALGRFLAGRRSRARRTESTTPVQSAVSPVPTAPLTGSAARVGEPVAQAGEGARYATLTTPATGVWSPLEAVKAKQMMQATPATRSETWEPPPRAAARAGGLGSGLGSGLGRGVAMIRNLSLALVAYGVLFVVFGSSNSPLSLDKIMLGGGFGMSEMQEMETPVAPMAAVPQVAPSASAAGGATVMAEVPAVEGAEEPAGVTGVAMAELTWLDDLRAQILWALGGVCLLLLVAGGILLSRRTRTSAGADPYDRLSQRLR